MDDERKVSTRVSYQFMLHVYSKKDIYDFFISQIRSNKILLFMIMIMIIVYYIYLIYRFNA